MLSTKHIYRLALFFIVYENILKLKRYENATYKEVENS